MPDLIQPQVLKGFRDALPAQELQRRTLMARLEQVFRSFGFVPIDTPALEYSEILLGKGGGETEKQMFRFEDNGGRDVALRFDLTVPFARFMATNLPQLALPFKRYHMAKVWRGEKPQKGRYREFFQCDCDIVGVDSAAADFEILAIMARSLEAVGAKDSTVLVNHRGLFNRFLEHLGVLPHSVEILRTVDKLSKIGREEVLSSLKGLIGPEAEQVLAFVETQGEPEDVLCKLEQLAGGSGEDSQRLRDVFSFLRENNLLQRFRISPSITRGLDYYTGIVFETVLNELPALGSVCSGGRYNDLANLYTKEKLPGVGGSVGLDRLLAGLEDLGLMPQTSTATLVLLLNQEPEKMGRAQAIAQQFRSLGIPAEVYLDQRKVPIQYKYAEVKGIPFVATLAPELTQDPQQQTFQLKNIRSGEVRSGVTVADSAPWILA